MSRIREVIIDTRVYGIRGARGRARLGSSDHQDPSPIPVTRAGGPGESAVSCTGSVAVTVIMIPTGTVTSGIPGPDNFFLVYTGYIYLRLVYYDVTIPLRSQPEYSGRRLVYTLPIDIPA